MLVRRFSCGILLTLMFAATGRVCMAVRYPNSTHNLLLDAKVSGNLESFHNGLRGEEGISWVVANLPPVDATLRPLPWPVRAGVRTVFTADKQHDGPSFRCSTVGSQVV